MHDLYNSQGLSLKGKLRKFDQFFCCGGGFFLTCKDFGGGFDDSFPTCPLMFLSGDQLAHTNSTFFLGQDQSTMAQQAEMTVAKCLLMRFVWARFPW